jgi:hypothetical protein
MLNGNSMHIVALQTFHIHILKISRKKYKNKNYLRSNNYEVCTPVAQCIPNILDVISGG